MVRWRSGTASSVVAVVVAVAVAGVGCGGNDVSVGQPDRITVFAAASLAEPFAELGTAFEARTDDVSVTFNFAASSLLVAQVEEGAPADVVASADEPSMRRLVEAVGTRRQPVVVAANRLAILVEPGNPLGIEGVDDLDDPDVALVTAAPEVPVGRYAEAVFAAAGVDPSPRSLEGSVQGVVSKVVLGEADAGIVYATDVQAAGRRADGVAIPDDVNVGVRYPMAVPDGAPEPALAGAFVDFALTEAGQAILASHGFEAP